MIEAWTTKPVKVLPRPVRPCPALISSSRRPSFANTGSRYQLLAPPLPSRVRAARKIGLTRTIRPCARRKKGPRMQKSRTGEETLIPTAQGDGINHQRFSAAPRPRRRGDRIRAPFAAVVVRTAIALNR